MSEEARLQAILVAVLQRLTAIEKLLEERLLGQAFPVRERPAASLKRRCRAVLASVAPLSMRPQDVADRLHLDDPRQRDVVYTALSKMARAREIDRTSRGHYREKSSGR